jgi:hypothetical protein
VRNAARNLLEILNELANLAFRCPAARALQRRPRGGRYACRAS